MRKKRILIFKKIKHNINIDYDNIIPTEIIPGYELDLPDITWTVTMDNKIAISIFSILAVMREKRKKIKLVYMSLQDDFPCELIIKSNKKDYIEFCTTFLSLLRDDVNSIETNID